MNGEMASTCDFRILGPLSVWAAGGELTISSPKQRVLLASLPLRAGQVVTSDDIIHRLRAAQPPQDTRAVSGPELQGLQRKLLTETGESSGTPAGPAGERDAGGPRLALGSAGPKPLSQGAPWVVRFQLPSEESHFVGREDRLAKVLDALAPRPSAGVPLVGPPGIGRTALALRVSHRLSADHPDGQWYVREVL
ncbi:hypothetical protein ACFRMQ_28310 [Kitasatospora sp. NPDC056783]|uniref:AfsR/SARP family transcriptional regulator n=1 Tax=Kitasatospora sp. NPDC056783 TaxID=3345943 RepID=UPI0036880391